MVNSVMIHLYCTSPITMVEGAIISSYTLDSSSFLYLCSYTSQSATVYLANCSVAVLYAVKNASSPVKIVDLQDIKELRKANFKKKSKPTDKRLTVSSYRLMKFLIVKSH